MHMSYDQAKLSAPADRRGTGTVHVTHNFPRCAFSCSGETGGTCTAPSAPCTCSQGAHVTLPAPLALPPTAVLAHVKRSGDSVSTVGGGFVSVSSTYSAIASLGVGLLTPDQETLHEAALTPVSLSERLSGLVDMTARCSPQPCLQRRWQCPVRTQETPSRVLRTQDV